MKRQTPKLPNDQTTFHYNTPPSSRRKISNNIDIVDESASLKKPNLHLPFELIVEILKRLPVKTLGMCLCVSKLWGSIIRSSDFKKLFLTESSRRPGRIFFNFRNDEDGFLFTSDETLNPGENSVASYHLTHPTHGNTKYSLSYLHDLVCYENDKDGYRTELEVYNSTTKRSIPLPKMEPAGCFIYKHFLSYDPINAVYKVLCACLTLFSERLMCKVLTLGNGNDQWREIKETPFQIPFSSQICTNGVLYYEAYADEECKEVVVMSFDVRSEKFDVIKEPAEFPSESPSTTASYEGKLAIISNEISADGSLVLWVLEDAAKHEWLKKVFVLPDLWTRLTYNSSLPTHELHSFFINITAAGEFVLAPLKVYVPPYYVLYYDPKRNSMRKASIEGIIEHEQLRWNEEDSWFLCNIFSSQVESLTFW